jgi:hypothetical protein
MTIKDQFGDVDAHGALIPARAAPSEAEHQAVIRDVPAAALPAGRFLRTEGSVTFRSSAQMHLVHSQQATALPRSGMRFRPIANIRLSNFHKPI